jgi:hypothetical protein
MKWKAIRDNFVRCHRQMTQTETGKAANNKKELYVLPSTAVPAPARQRKY